MYNAFLRKSETLFIMWKTFKQGWALEGDVNLTTTIKFGLGKYDWINCWWIGSTVFSHHNIPALIEDRMVGIN